MAVFRDRSQIPIMSRVVPRRKIPPPLLSVALLFAKVVNDVVFTVIALSVASNAPPLLARLLIKVVLLQISRRIEMM